MAFSVMVPCDFSDEFEYVAAFIHGLPALGVDRVVLGHVVEASGLEGPVIAAKVDRARASAHTYADPLTAAGIDIEVRVSTGTDAARELLAIAIESGVDMVAAGTHAKEGLAKLVERSVSEEVVWHADVPVLLVRYELLRNAEFPAALASSYARTLLVGTDFSHAAERCFAAVLALPPKAVGTAFILHTIDPNLPDDRRAEAEASADVALRDMVARAAEKGITARSVIRTGDPVRTMLQEANERRATGIVVGTRGRNPIAGEFLGSVSLTLLRQASCPVMIVP